MKIKAMTLRIRALMKKLILPEAIQKGLKMLTKRNPD